MTADAQRDRERLLAVYVAARDSLHAPRLSDDERAKRERDARLARDKCVEANIGLVAVVAEKVQRRHPVDVYDDLMQVGAMGLTKSVERFDQARGTTLSTFSRAWIRQHLDRYLHDTGRGVRVPVWAHARHHAISRARSRLWCELQRQPSAEETAAAARVAVAEVRHDDEIFRSPRSLDAELSSDFDGGLTLGDVIADNSAEPPDVQVERADRVRVARKLLAAVPLDARSKAVLAQRTERTLDSCASELGVTRERVRQIEVRALKQLRYTATRTYRHSAETL